jgi:glycosyltransferase involved in cell wall biosynthesis
MAAGTPVIAWPNGSVSEVVEHGRSGFIVETIDQAVAAVDAARSLPRAGIRADFEQRFTADRMARDYLRLYESLADRRPAFRFGKSKSMAG